MRPFRYASPQRVLVPMLLALVLSGCGTMNPLRGVEPGPDSAWSRPASTPSRPTSRPAAPPPTVSARTARPTSVEMGPSVRAEAPVLLGSAALAGTLRGASQDWLGIPYRYGGTTRAGMDCSAFARAYLGDVLGVALSRSTASQVQEGVEVDRKDLLPGDLVFFLRRRTRHVGVYLGGGEFIHASSSNGVIISRLDEGYYQRHYWTARRIVDDPARFLAQRPGPPPVQPRETTPAASPSDGASGW